MGFTGIAVLGLSKISEPFALARLQWIPQGEFVKSNEYSSAQT
jgi:hypothetical protein